MLFDRGNDRPGRLSREVCDVVPKFRSFGGGGDGDGAPSMENKKNCKDGASGSFESISENFL